MKQKRYYLIRSFTLIGNLFPQFLVLCFITFFVDFDKGAYISSIWFFGYAVNLLLKNTIRKARPSSENAKVSVKGYSLPSGHAFMSTVFFFTVSSFFIFPVYVDYLCTLVPIFLGLSRLYLKVHDHWDIIAGWFFALAYLFLFSKTAIYICSKVLILMDILLTRAT
ncbi:MAG: phosphatase PAP2 family protein [Candidatus Caenarcaniphilales bacterium]|nr:phosphatase PAP2 family protein [Candidatus Caenarcaniphilales bacterium]